LASQIRIHRQVVPRISGHHKRTPPHAQQVVFAHHPQHPFAIDREASVSQLGGDSSIAVGRRFHRDLLHLIADLHLDRGSLPWRS